MHLFHFNARAREGNSSVSKEDVLLCYVNIGREVLDVKSAVLIKRIEVVYINLYSVTLQVGYCKVSIYERIEMSRVKPSTVGLACVLAWLAVVAFVEQFFYGNTYRSISAKLSVLLFQVNASQFNMLVAIVALEAF